MEGQLQRQAFTQQYNPPMRQPAAYNYNPAYKPDQQTINVQVTQSVPSAPPRGYQPPRPIIVQPNPTPQPIIVQQPVPIVQQIHPTPTVGTPRGARPCTATCALCGHTATTQVKRAKGIKFWGLCLASIPVWACCACCCIPFFECAYGHYHYCRKCNNVIAKDNEFDC